MRIFRNCEDMVREIDRELAVTGITTPVKHYQNKMLTGDDQLTKELIGVNFTISRPWIKKHEMLQFLYKDEVDIIERYCIQEHRDRISGEPLNPGNSYLIRADLWQKFLNTEFLGGKYFDYTYADRITRRTPGHGWYNQIDNVVNCLTDDAHSRRAMMMIMDPEDTRDSAGAITRIPCSVSYQFLIRDNQLHCLYYIRSNDYFKHFGIDIWLAQEMQSHIASRLTGEYPDLKPGPLHYTCGSLHAYNEDLSKWVIY